MMKLSQQKSNQNNTGIGNIEATVKDQENLIHSNKKLRLNNRELWLQNRM